MTLPKVNFDDSIKNQDWPKRTDDTYAALGLSSSISKFNPYHDELGRFTTADKDVTGAAGGPHYHPKSGLRARALEAMGRDPDQGELFDGGEASLEVRDWEGYIRDIDRRQRWYNKLREADAERTLDEPADIPGLDYQPGVWTEEQAAGFKQLVQQSLHVDIADYESLVTETLVRYVTSVGEEEAAPLVALGLVTGIHDGGRTVDVDMDRAQELGVVPTAEELGLEIASAVRHKLDDPYATPAIRVGSDDLLEAVVGDEYLNGFQAGGSSSVGFNNARRMFIEETGMNVPQGATNTQRPVYGYLRTSEHDEWDGKVEQYGEYRLALSPSAMSRATVTIGDSFGMQTAFRVQESPLPNWALLAMANTKQGSSLWEREVADTVMLRLDRLPGVQGAIREGLDYSGYVREEFEEGNYVELQVHGALNISTDVVSLDTGGGYHRPSDALLAAVDLISKRKWPVVINDSFGYDLEGDYDVANLNDSVRDRFIEEMAK